MAYTFHSSGHILQIITITPKLWPKQRAYESLHFSFACLCSTDRSRTLIRSSLSRCCLPTSLSINACSDTKTWHGTEIMSDHVPGWWVILVCLKKGVFWICFCFLWRREIWRMFTWEKYKWEETDDIQPEITTRKKRLRSVFNPLWAEALKSSSTKESMKESVPCPGFLFGRETKQKKKRYL